MILAEAIKTGLGSGDLFLIFVIGSIVLNIAMIITFFCMYARLREIQSNIENIHNHLDTQHNDNTKINSELKRMNNIIGILCQIEENTRK